MILDPTVNIICKISYTRDVVQKATFQLEKNVAKMKEIIWVKTLYRIQMVPNSFESEISTFKTVNALVN